LFTATVWCLSEDSRNEEKYRPQMCTDFQHGLLA
jgi:hypothetical protein